MSGQSFRWRTIIEVAVISAVIYVILGAPGLSAWSSSLSIQEEAPVVQAKVESLVYPDKDLKCSEHKFDIHILGTNPLVIYIDSFVTESEAQHLIDIRYEPYHVIQAMNSCSQ